MAGRQGDEEGVGTAETTGTPGTLKSLLSLKSLLFSSPYAVAIISAGSAGSSSVPNITLRRRSKKLVQRVHISSALVTIASTSSAEKSGSIASLTWRDVVGLLQDVDVHPGELLDAADAADRVADAGDHRQVGDLGAVDEAEGAQPIAEASL